MANKNTFAIPCNQEINVDIIEQEQVGVSLAHEIGMFLKPIFPLFYPHYALCAAIEFGVPKIRMSESPR